MYKSVIPQAIDNWNKANPTLRKLTLTSIAKQIGCSQPYLSGIGKSKEFDSLFSVVFFSKRKGKIRREWEYWVKYKSPLIQRLEAIRKILGCEIYDLIKRG